MGGLGAEWVTKSEPFYHGGEVVSRGTGGGSPRGFPWAPALPLRQREGLRDGLSQCFLPSKVSDEAQREPICFDQS